MNSICINQKQWSKLYKYLKSHPRLYTIDEASCKCFIEGVFWIMRTGAQWRELPERYGYWNTVFHRFNEWSKKNIWHDILEYFTSDPDMESVLIDATIVRAHACSAGYQNSTQETQGLGRSCGGFSSKIHVATDALGNPLEIVITPGQEHDIQQAENLIEGIKDAYIIGDKGYDCDEFIATIGAQNCKAVIPPKSNRKIQREYDKHAYKERHLIECFFGKIKYFRRIFSRFDKTVRNYVSF